MSTYPKVPGHNNVHTSIAAAASVTEKASSIRSRIYALLLDGHQITSEEAAIKLGMWKDRNGHGNCWKRFSELRADGLAEDSGITRINKVSGEKAIVWKLREGEGTDIKPKESKAHLRKRIASLEAEGSRLREENERLKSPPSSEQQMAFL